MNGSSVDMARLRKAYESNPYEAEQLLKVQDVQLYSSPVFFLPATVIHAPGFGSDCETFLKNNWFKYDNCT